MSCMPPSTSDAIALVRQQGAVTLSMVRRHLGLKRSDAEALMAAAVDSGEIFGRLCTLQNMPNGL